MLWLSLAKLRNQEPKRLNYYRLTVAEPDSPWVCVPPKPVLRLPHCPPPSGRLDYRADGDTRCSRNKQHRRMSSACSEGCSVEPSEPLRWGADHWPRWEGKRHQEMQHGSAPQKSGHVGVPSGQKPGHAGQTPILSKEIAFNHVWLLTFHFK